MSLLNIALGFLRDAVGQRVGQEVADTMRAETADKPEIDLEARLAHHRAQVNADLETLAVALRHEHTRLGETIRRQRQWNWALAAATAVALAVAVWAAVY